MTLAINIEALTVAVGLALLAMAGGVKNLNTPGLSPGGVPFRTIGVMSFVLATALLLAAVGDPVQVSAHVNTLAANLRRRHGIRVSSNYSRTPVDCLVIGRMRHMSAPAAEPNPTAPAKVPSHPQ